jgi:tetratricopeptide (TPR) repeat protein
MPRRPSEHVDDPAAVGRRLREARKRAGLTQRDLSFPGCTAAYVSRIEAGARVPSYQILREFAKRVGVTADYLATGSTNGGDSADPLFEAELALRLGDEDQAETLYERISKTSEASPAAMRANVGLAQLALRRGDTQRALELLEGALESGQLPLGDASVAGNALGRLYSGQGRFEEAFEIFARFLEEARSREDQFDIVRFSVLLANAYVDSGNFPRAQEVLGDVLQLARRVVDPMLQASLYWSQSRLYLAQERNDLAAHYAHLTHSILETSEHSIEAARALLLLAMIENEQGNHSTALELVNEGEPVVAAAGQAVDVSMFAIERARALDALGEAEEAASLLLGAVSQLRAASPTNAGRAYATVAEFFRSRGDTAKALELYELAAEELVAPDRHLADVLTAMAEIYEEQGRADEALQFLKRAVRVRAGVDK